MQPAHFSTKVIFLKGSVISLSKVALKQKMSFLLNKVFGQKFTRNEKKIPSATFAIFNTQLLLLRSRIGISVNVKIIHYIQPSNLSSALVLY